MARPTTYTLLQVARELGVHRNAVLKWVRLGTLRANRGHWGRAGRYRVPVDALTSFVARWARTASGQRRLAARASQALGEGGAE